MESCFPRGGVIPKKSSFSSSAPASVNVGDRTKRIEFGPSVSRHSKKEKLNRKQREKKQIAKNSVNANINNVAGGGVGGGGGSGSDSDDSDDDSVNGSGTTTQQFAKANLLTNRSISVGMKLMGVIISIDTTFLLVLLPGGLIGKVLVSRISNAYIDLLSTVMKNDAETLNVNDSTMDVPYKILTELYSIGQMVCVKLIENVSSTRGTQHHNNIMLSMLPNDLNDQFVHNQLKKHLYLWVSISSCEDHGYICETGIKNLRGFIPRTEVHAGAAVGTNPGNANDEKFNVGYQICCKIVNVQLAKSASTVTLKPQSSDKMQLKKFLHINWLVPMVLVKFKINRILKNGLHGTIKFDSDAQSTNEKLIGIVNEHNLINIFDKPSQKEYEIGQILMARILYVMPITKIIYLTLNLNAGGRGIAYDDDDEGTDKSEHRLKDGTIIENAIVLRHTSNGIMLKLNDHCKGIIAYKQLRYHHLNFDKDEILLKYYQNSVHRVRVLHYNIMDSFYMCSINKNVLEEQYYKLDDVNVGDFVKAKICRALDDKGYFITVGHILGYLQYSCIAAKYRKPNKIKINDMMSVRILKKTDNRVFVTNQREFMNKSYTIPFDRKDLKKNQQYYGRIVCEFPRAYVIDLAQDLCGLLFKKTNLKKPTSSRHDDDDDDDDDANLKLNIGDVKQFEIKQFGIGKSKEKFVLTLKNSNNQDQLKTEDKKIIELNDTNKKSIKEEKIEKNDKKKEEEKITKSLTLIDDAGKTQTQKEKAKAKSIKNTNTNSSFLNVTDFHIEKLTKDGLYFTSLSNNIHNGYIPNKFISDYPDLWKAKKAAQQNCDIPLAQLIRCIAEGPVSTPVSDDDDCDEDSPAPPVLVKVRNELYCLNANAENFNTFSQLQIGQLICGNIENITNQFVEIGIVMLPDGDDSNTNTNNKAIKETQLKTITIKLHINNLLDRHILNNKHIRININLVYGQKLYLKIIGKNIHEKYLHFSGKLSDVWNYNLNVSATLLNNYFNEINKIENGIKQQQPQQQKKKKEQNATTTTTILSELAKYKIGDLIDVGDILITNWISETNKIWVKCYQNKIDGVITSGSHSFKPSDLNNDNWKTLKLTGPAIIIWIDYGRQQIYLTIRKNIVERFLRCPTMNGNTNNNNNENETEKIDDKGNVRRQPIMKQLINARGLKCDILLAHSDFTITLPRKLITNQFVFIPRRLHLNDFDGTILRSDFIEGDIVNVTIIKTDGFHLIGIYDSVFKAITNVMEMNNKRENDGEAKIELGKHKTTNDNKDSKNEQLNVKRKKFNDTVDEDDEDEDSSMEVDNENASEHYQDKPDSDDHQDSDDDDDDDDDDESEGDDEDEGEGGDEDSDADDGDSDNDEGDSDDGEDEENDDDDDDEDDDDEDEDDEDDKDDADDNEDDDDDEDDDEEDEPKHLTNSIGLDQQLDGAVDFLPKKIDKKLLGVDNFWNINNKKSHEDISKSSSDEENDVDADADANKMLLDKNLTARSKSLLQNAKERFQEVRKKEYEIEKLEKQLLEPDALPTTADHFDRLLLDEPNNSIIWIKYMCFHLQYNELDKTRSIGQKALKTISYLCTDELLNIWVALLNLELRYGSGTDSFNVCLTNALQRNDPYRVYTACIRMYIDVGVVGDKQKTELNALLDIVQKKFRSMAEMWSMVATAYFDVRLMDKGKQMLNKGLKSIPEKEHINLIIKFANLNHKYNELETAHALFEQVLIAYPKRVDCWSQYIDMYIKSNDIESARQTLDRATSQKIPMKKMRILFKKYVEFEERFGNAQKIEEIKLRAANLINKEMFNNNNNN